MTDEDLRELERAARRGDAGARDRLWAARCRLHHGLSSVFLAFSERVDRLLRFVNTGCSNGRVTRREVADVLRASERKPAAAFVPLHRGAFVGGGSAVDVRVVIVACRAAGPFFDYVTLGIGYTADLVCSEARALANIWPSLSGALGTAKTEAERRLREEIAVAWATNTRVERHSKAARVHVLAAEEWAARFAEDA